MAGGYSITISAVDGASATLGKINKDLERLSAPVTRFNKEIGKLADNTGITRIGEGFRGLGRIAADTARSIESVASPMGVLTSAASIGGVLALARAWSEFGANLGIAAQRANIPVTQLSRLQGAARLAGVSADEATTGITRLQDALENAAVGNPAGRAAQVMFNTVGLSIRNADGSARKAMEILPELADTITRMKGNSTAQSNLLSAVGLSDAWLPFLSKGRAGLMEFLRQFDQTGAGLSASSVKRATEMKHAWERLALDLEGVGNRIMDTWSPTITGALEGTSHWIEGNKGLADSIAQIGTAILALGALKPVAWVMRLLGLGGTAAGVSGAASLAPTAAGVLSLSGDTPTDQRNLQSPEAQAAIRAEVERQQGGRGNWRTLWDNVTGSWGSPRTATPHARTPNPYVGGLQRPIPSGVLSPNSGTTAVPPEGRALLDAIAAGESGGRYDVMYGGGRISDFADHPRQAVPIQSGPNAGRTSSAAGRYQFLGSTWDDVASKIGARDFSPENQDKGAWFLAQRDYRARTGRDLGADLKSSDPAVRAGIGPALHNTWTSLPGGIEPNSATGGFNARLTAGLGAAQAPPAVPPPVTGAPGPNGAVSVDITHTNPPAGTSARVVSSGDVTAGPARVVRAMPEFAM